MTAYGYYLAASIITKPDPPPQAPPTSHMHKHHNNKKKQTDKATCTAQLACQPACKSDLLKPPHTCDDITSCFAFKAKWVISVFLEY